MKLLLDTHRLIWFIMGDTRLPIPLRMLIETIENQRFVSVASIWEIAIKMSLGKLDMGASFPALVPGQLISNRIEILPISVMHLQQVAQLPFHHRDPFARLLIAQSQVEQLPLLSRDSIFDTYRVQRLWAQNSTSN